MPEEAPRRPHTAFHAFCQGRQLNPRVAAEEWAQMSAAEKKVRNPIFSPWNRGLARLCVCTNRGVTSIADGKRGNCGGYDLGSDSWHVVDLYGHGVVSRGTESLCLTVLCVRD